MDREEDRGNEREDEHKDPGYQRYLGMPEEIRETVADPLEIHSLAEFDRESDREESAANEAAIEEISACIDRLAEKQKDLVYALFGELRTLEEVAKKDGVTRQAIKGRIRSLPD